MDNSGSYHALPTLISLWSAMLGGAIGGALGKISPNVLCSGIIGFLAGASASVLAHMILYTIWYVVTSYILQVELGNHAVGGYKGDFLASVLGGIGGLCTASILTLALPSQNLQTPQTFSVCWSAATFFPMISIFIIMWRTKRS